MTEASSRRADQTRDSLMRAAEHLFAEHGIENVSVRLILKEAGQRNESALHYHFGSVAGLIEALQEQRVTQVIELRRRAIDAATANGREPDVREICLLLVEAPFGLCARDRGFRDFISVFGQRVATSRNPVNEHLQEHQGARLEVIRALLQKHLTGLDEPLFDMRVENMGRFTMLALSRRARNRESFRGKAARLFLNDLADTMAGMLTAPVSARTREVIDER